MFADFLIYLACISFGAAVGMLWLGLCLAAKEPDELVRRGRNRWWR